MALGKDMSGTKRGGRLAYEKNIRRYGKDFYRKIGAKGGKASNTGGFAAGEEGRKRASIYGALGGAKSRRRSTAQ